MLDSKKEGGTVIFGDMTEGTFRELCLPVFPGFIGFCPCFCLETASLKKIKSKKRTESENEYSKIAWTAYNRKILWVSAETLQNTLQVVKKNGGHFSKHIFILCSTKNNRNFSCV